MHEEGLDLASSNSLVVCKLCSALQLCCCKHESMCVGICEL